MKLIKLNRKYALSHKWAFALDFGTRINDKRARAKYARAFEKLYGPDRDYNPEYTLMGKSPMYLLNQNWYNDPHRGRIYFNQESAYTMIKLMGL